jgi:hypothetical protein
LWFNFRLQAGAGGKTGVRSVFFCGGRGKPICYEDAAVKSKLLFSSDTDFHR